MKICNAKVYQNGKFSRGDISIRGERFASVERTETVSVPEKTGDNEEMTIDALGLLAIPGLVDIHFHGCVGYDMCDGTEEAIQAMADYQQSVGVLAICPATMTYPEEKLTVIAEAAAAHVNGKGADLVGLHMEGPFISPNKVGAQNPAYVQCPDAEMFIRLQKKAGGLFKQCDVAPEEPGALEFIAAIKETVPSISIAHTTTDYDTAMAAFNAGANHLTHCYNAMPGINHRNPGPIIAAADAGADAELICDNVHIHPAVVRSTFKLFGDDHVVLISDSMMACGLPDGQYSLGGQAVTVKGRLAVLTEQEGTIAGSASNLMDCMRRAVKEMDIPLESAVKAASHNPARCIGIDDDYGDIEAGKYANVLLLDEDLNLVHVVQRGVLIF
ncbi:MAG: N-acetylglucosamine-6-phosphate deacetylase [Lachnospiraceae bacterium]|nr:N-acetylglucosamine-6-phosphate deacetylase [Lachnospiraceae bacterium]